MSWNLWWRFGPWQQRHAAIAATIRGADPDIVGLQEVWGEVGGADQAARLGDELGLHHAFASLSDHDGLRFGNAVLSRWPIRRTAHRALPSHDGGRSYRLVLLAEVDGPGGRVQVFTTHLDWQYDRSAHRQVQAAVVAEFVADHRSDEHRSDEHRGDEHREDGAPPILTGDLNAEPTSDEVRMLTGRTAVPVPGLMFHDAWEHGGDGSPGHTWCRTNPYLERPLWPGRRLDYVLVGWPRTAPRGSVERAWLAGVDPVAGVQPSDHYAVVADLQW